MSLDLIPERKEALAALSKIHLGQEPEKYLPIYADAMLRAAEIEPLETASEAFRIFVTNRLGWVGSRKETEEDKPLRNVALETIKYAGLVIASSPELGGPEAAIELANSITAQRSEFHGWAYAGWSPEAFNSNKQGLVSPSEREASLADPLFNIVLAIRETAIMQATFNAEQSALAAAPVNNGPFLIDPAAGIAAIQTDNRIPLRLSEMPSMAAD